MDNNQEKEEEINKQQVEYVTLKRKTDYDLSQKGKTVEELTDQVKVFKKYGERQKEDKDRVKKKLKETETQREDLKKEISNFKMLE